MRRVDMRVSFKQLTTCKVLYCMLFKYFDHLLIFTLKYSSLNKESSKARCLNLGAVKQYENKVIFTAKSPEKLEPLS